VGVAVECPRCDRGYGELCQELDEIQERIQDVRLRYITGVLARARTCLSSYQQALAEIAQGAPNPERLAKVALAEPLADDEEAWYPFTLSGGVTAALGAPLSWGAPRQVLLPFAGVDPFGGEVSSGAIAAVFGVMAACPQHQFQVITQHPEKVADWLVWLDWAVAKRRKDEGTTLTPLEHCLQTALAWEARVGDPQALWPLTNVWIGETTQELRPLSAFAGEKGKTR
jgi:hypothetical protein